MIPNSVRTGRRATTSVFFLIVVALAIAIPANHAFAQASPSNPEASPQAPKTDTATYRTFYLSSVAEQRNANDVVTDLRNMLPQSRFYYVESQYAVSMRGAAEDIQAAQKILADIDRPRKLYRLTYSLAEIDGDKTVSTQKVSLIALDGGNKVTLKQGGKIPIVTGASGTSDSGNSAQNTQVQYIDTGLTIEATIAGAADALRLSTRVEQSSVADQRASAAVPDPTFRHTALDAMAALVPGKPLVLGSLDIPGTTRREEVTVVMELIR